MPYMTQYVGMAQITPLLMPHEISADIEYENPDTWILGYLISAVLGFPHEITVDLFMPFAISADIEYDNPAWILGYFISAVLIWHIDNQCLDPLKIFVPQEVGKPLLNIVTENTPLTSHEISLDLVYNSMIRSCSLLRHSQVSCPTQHRLNPHQISCDKVNCPII